MEPEPIVPNPSLVSDARMRFDKDNAVVEQALEELFRQYPANDNEAHVLLKVVALNRLYSTNILAVQDVARHIYRLAPEIDDALKAGSPEVVDKIANVTISATRKRRKFWSFATKYCNWHQHELFPIWDSRVNRCLRSLKGSPFTRPDNWTRYREFVDLMQQFRDFYNLGEFTFKEIDKFLWVYGGDQ